LDRAPEQLLGQSQTVQTWTRGGRESNVSQVSWWLWDGGRSGAQEEESPRLEAGTRGLVRDSRPRGRNACAVKRRLCEFAIAPL
jgi:hypothetical protein